MLYIYFNFYFYSVYLSTNRESAEQKVASPKKNFSGFYSGA